MDEKNILSGGIDTLYTMKENLLELEGYREKKNTLAMEEEETEKQLSLKTKEMNNEVLSVTKKRKDELEFSFDKQIDETKARMKKVKSKKDKMKNAKVSERIELETADLREEKMRYLEEIKRLHKSNGISSVFNNSLYYALFLPRSLKEAGILLGTLILVLFAIPVGVYHFLLPDKSFYLILSYIVTILIFGGFYLVINKNTKEKHAAAYKQIKALRSTIRMAQKKINNMKREILKDKDESKYGLEKFNEELLELDKQITQIAEEKKEAVISFESKAKLAIAEEIKQKYKEELQILEEKHASIYEEQRKAEEMAKQFAVEISAKYEAFVGKEILSLPVLDKMIECMESGQANTISEAIKAVESTEKAEIKPISENTNI